MKLYYSPGACSLAPHIVLEEIGADYALECVPVAEGKTQSEAYLAVNAKGRVPTLACDIGVLTEAPAILFYLGLSHPQAGLLPQDPGLLARAAEWLNWLSGDLHATGFGALWRPHRFTPDADAQAAVSAAATVNIRAAYARIETFFAQARWAVGDTYSCVDSYLLVFYRWGNRIGLDMRAEYPAWTRHAEAVAHRPATIRALAREGISIW